MRQLSEDLEQHDYAYLTTTGRVTGEDHRIEIWFTVIEGLLWVNSGGHRRSDWVKNLMADPRLMVEIGHQRWDAEATIRDGLAEHVARERLAERYQGWQRGQALSDWARNSLLIRIEVDDGSRRHHQPHRRDR